MGRQKGSKDKGPRKRRGQAADESPPEHETEAAAGLGHNSSAPVEFTVDERRAITFHHKRLIVSAEEVVTGAKKALKEAKERAKLVLGDTAIDDIQALIQVSTPEGELAAKKEIETKIQALRWSGLPIGAEPDLFDEPDRTPAIDLAYEAGKVAGLDGKVCQPPHDPSVPQHQRWISGWHDGQAALMSAFKKLEVPETPLEEAIGDGEPDAEGASEQDSDDGRDFRPRHLQRRDQERSDAVGDAKPTYTVN